MPGSIMTEVSAVVCGECAGEVAVAFAGLAQRPLPEGLVRTELLAGDGEWTSRRVTPPRPDLAPTTSGPGMRAPARADQIGGYSRTRGRAAQSHRA